MAALKQLQGEVAITSQQRLNRRAMESKAMAHKLGPHWREAPDSWVGTQRRAIVAFSSRRAVGAKNTPQQPAALGTRTCQVFTEGRGTTVGCVPRTILSIGAQGAPYIFELVRGSLG